MESNANSHNLGHQVLDERPARHGEFDSVADEVMQQQLKLIKA